MSKLNYEQRLPLKVLALNTSYSKCLDTKSLLMLKISKLDKELINCTENYHNLQQEYSSQINDSENDNKMQKMNELMKTKQKELEKMTEKKDVAEYENDKLREEIISLKQKVNDATVEIFEKTILSGGKNQARIKDLEKSLDNCNAISTKNSNLLIEKLKLLKQCDENSLEMNRRLNNDLVAIQLKFDDCQKQIKICQKSTIVKSEIRQIEKSCTELQSKLDDCQTNFQNLKENSETMQFNVKSMEQDRFTFEKQLKDKEKENIRLKNLIGKHEEHHNGELNELKNSLKEKTEKLKDTELQKAVLKSKYDEMKDYRAVQLMQQKIEDCKELMEKMFIVTVGAMEQTFELNHTKVNEFLVDYGKAKDNDAANLLMSDIRQEVDKALN